MPPKWVNCTSVLLLMLLMTEPGYVMMSKRQSKCGDGEVRDLDGTCVEKVVIPRRKEKCPAPNVDNGEYFLMGRMVQFYCDTGYVMVPDTEIAICQVTGRWSKQVPVCLLPGCQDPIPPPHGSVSLPPTYNNTLAKFSCDPNHLLTGAPILACIDGTSWNGSSPSCEKGSKTSQVLLDYSTPTSGVTHMTTFGGLVILLQITVITSNYL